MIQGILCKYFVQFFPEIVFQKLKLGNVFVCSIDEHKDDQSTVFSGTGCGADFVWSVAVMKALSEYVERKAWCASNAKSTTGFAAYPFVFRRKRAIRKARKNAYLEMFERYAWIEWFSNTSIGYSFDTNVSENCQQFYRLIRDELQVQGLYCIYPKILTPDEFL